MENVLCFYVSYQGEPGVSQSTFKAAFSDFSFDIYV